MNYQFGPATHGWGTIKLSGAAGQVDASLKTLLEAAAVAQQPTALAGGLLDPRITGLTLFVNAATTFYWENNGTVADATKMPVATGDYMPPVPVNNRELLGTIRIVVTGVYDLRVMLW